MAAQEALLVGRYASDRPFSLASSVGGDLILIAVDGDGLTAYDGASLVRGSAAGN